MQPVPEAFAEYPQDRLQGRGTRCWLGGFLFRRGYRSGKKAKTASRVAANFVGWGGDPAQFACDLGKGIRALGTGAETARNHWQEDYESHSGKTLHVLSL